MWVEGKVEQRGGEWAGHKILNVAYIQHTKLRENESNGVPVENPIRNKQKQTNCEHFVDSIFPQILFKCCFTQGNLHPICIWHVFFRGCSDVIELSFGMLWAYSCPTNSQILTDLFIFSKGSLVNLPYPLAIMQRAYTQIMLCHLVPSSSSQLGHDPSGGRGDGWNKCWNSGMSLCHV